MTDEEIGLAKAMLKRGLRNDEIHFYFNRSERLISSGRIAQIKTGIYGHSVLEATPEALDGFFAEWTTRQIAINSSPTDRAILMSMFSQSAGRWSVMAGETDTIECKRNFCLSPERRFADVTRSIAGFANNKGGYIFFGITNSQFTVEGLSNDAFEVADPAEINQILSGALDPVPHVTKIISEIGSRKIGVLYVEKHTNAPVIALKEYRIRGKRRNHLL